MFAFSLFPGFSTGTIIPWGAVLFSGALALAVLLRARSSTAAWLFVAGMTVLAAESAAEGIMLMQTGPPQIIRWYIATLCVKALIPSTWLAFSLTYSRGDYGLYLARGRRLLIAALVIPAGLVLGSGAGLSHFQIREYEEGGWGVHYGLILRILNLAVMLATIGILANIEKTLRGAVGTMQWRIKFTALGLGIIFGTRVYIECQGLLFASYDLNLSIIKASAVLIGSALMMVAYVRHGFNKIDVYLSRSVLQTSVTVLLAGIYLFIVGVLAQAASFVGGAGSFRFQALVLLLGIALLAVLLLSDRLRQKLRAFISRHFRRPQHDSRAIWTQFTRRLSTADGKKKYCEESVRLVAETFHVLSVTILLIDPRKEWLILEASTSGTLDQAEEPETGSVASPDAVLTGLRKMAGPFNLEQINDSWAKRLKLLTTPRFPEGGNRMGVPLRAGNQELGVMVLADRVNAVSYTVEEVDLLKCIGDHVAAGLLQLRLTEELMQGKEMEAFQAMSTFFVHDLKNAAFSLGLMLENLPVHFDNPAFREDAFRGIASTVGRINQIIERLGTLRQKLELKPVQTDINQLVTKALAGLGGLREVELIQDLQPVPAIPADPDQLENVIINLLLNAKEALGREGKITVKTFLHDGRATLSVEDNGSGMTAVFIKDSLFRPFYTTKKKGLGIGMFQSRMIVEAHRGVLQVESEPGRGSVFRVLLPLKSEAA